MTDPKASKLRLPTKIRRPCSSTPSTQSSPPSPSRYVMNSSVMLTEDTDSFIIGDRVWVGGTKPGSIAYIGETQFAPGDWAGVVLDEPIGKNDGSLAGLRYFQCEPKRGIFSRLTRLTRQPLSGSMLTSPNGDQTPSSYSQSSRGNHSKSVSPSLNSSMTSLTSTSQRDLKLGDRVIVSSSQGRKTGVLRYMGATRFAPGEWCGIELDEPNGKNDGSVDETRYFECRPKYGLFTPSHKVTRSPTNRRTSLAQKASAFSPIGASYSRRISGSRESLSSVSSITSPNSGIPTRSFTSGSRETGSSSRSLKSSPVRDYQLRAGSSAALMYDRERNQSELGHGVNERTDVESRDGESKDSPLNQEYEWLQRKYYEKEKRLENMRADLEKKMLLLHDECEKSRCASDCLATERLEMVKSMEELKKHLKIILDEKKQLETAIIDKNAYLKKLETEISSIQKERDNAIATAHSFNTKYNETLKQLEELNSLQTYTETESSLEFDCLREQLLQADVKKKNLAERLEQSENAVKELNEKLQEYTSTTQKEESHQSAVSDALKNAQNSVRSLKERLDISQKELNEELDERSRVNVQLQERVRTLEAQLSETTIALNEKNELEEIKDASVKNLEEQIQSSQKELNEQLEERNKVNIELQERIRTLEVQMNEATTALNEKSKLEEINDASVRNLEERLQSSQKELCEQLEERNKVNIELQERILSLETQLIETTTALNEKSKLDEIRDISVKHLEEQLQSSQKALSEQLDERSRVNVELQERIRSLQAQLSETTIELDEKNELHEIKDASVKHLEEQLQSSQKELSEQLEERSKFNIELQERIHSLEAQLQETSLALTEKSKLAEIREASVKNLEERLQTSQEKFNEQLEEGSRVNAGLQERIRSVESELSITKTIMNEKNRTVDDINDKSAKNLEERSKINVILQERINSVELELSKAKVELDARNKMIEAVKEDSAKDLEARLQGLQREFNEQLNERNRVNNELQGQVQSLESELSQMKTILHEKTQTEGVKDASAKNLEGKLQSSQKEFNGQLEERNKVNIELQQRIRTLEAQLNEMTTALIEKSKLEEIKDASVRHLEERLQSSQKELSERLEERNKVNVELQEQILSLEAQIKETTTTLNEKNKLEEIKDASVKNLEERLQSSEKELTEQLAERSKANVELQKRTVFLEAQMIEMKSALNEKNKLEEIKDASVKNLEERLQSSQKKLGEQLAERSKANVELQERIVFLEAQLIEMKSALNEKNKLEVIKDASVKNLEERLKASQKELSEKLEERSKANFVLQERICSLESELNQTTTILSEKTKLEESNVSSVRNLEVRLQNSQQDLNEQLEERNRVNIELQERIASLESIVGQTKNALIDKDKTIDEITTKMAKTTSALEEFTNASKTKEAQTEEIADIVHELQREKTELHERINALNELKISQDAAIEKMKAEMDHLRNIQENLAKNNRDKESLIITDLKEKITELQKENEKLLQSNVTKNEFSQPGKKPNIKTENQQLSREQNHLTAQDSQTSSTLIQENFSIATDFEKRLKTLADENETYKGQIEFLNSVIVDMQRKNEALKCKIEVLEIGVPSSEADDYNRSTLSNRAAAPRMFCDICDRFDLHETEDCPRQAQDFVEPERPMRSPKKPSIERPYCDNCESFGHDTEHCDDTETF